MIERREIIGPHIDAGFELERFVELVLEGFGYGLQATKVTEIIREGTTSGGAYHALRDDAVYEERLRQAKKLEVFAKEQEEHGFPYTYSLATVRLWSILEAAVTDAVRYLMRQPESLPDASPVLRIKGPLLQYANAADDERSDILFEMLKQEVQSRLHRGVGRLEVLLESVGLGGGIDDIVRRVILELSEVRNVAVHRNGRADRRLIEHCPWLGLKEGEYVLADHCGFEMYMSACSWYLLDVDRRLRSPADEGDESEVKYLDKLDATQAFLVTRLSDAWQVRRASAPSPA